MKIQIGFSKTNTFVSKTIRWFLDAQISHVYIKLYDEFLGVEIVFHSDLPGVVIEMADQFDKLNETIYLFEIEDKRLKKSIKQNLRLLGRKYDNLELFSWAWTIAFRRWMKKKKSRPFEDPKKLICVDLVIKILNNAEITDLPNCTLNPLTFLEWCNENYENLGWKKIEPARGITQ